MYDTGILTLQVPKDQAVYYVVEMETGQIYCKQDAQKRPVFIHAWLDEEAAVDVARRVDAQVAPAVLKHLIAAARNAGLGVEIITGGEAYLVSKPPSRGGDEAP